MDKSQTELPAIALVQGNFVLNVNNYPFVHEKRRYAQFDGLGSESDALLAVVGMVVVIGFALLFGGYAARAKQFDTASKTISAELTDHYENTQTTTDRNGNKLTETYDNISYQYTVDGQTYTHKEMYPEGEGFAAQWSDGKPVIQYLTTDPSQSRLARTPSVNFTWLLVIVVVIVLLVPEIVVLWCFARNYRLTRKGQMLEGRITSSRGQYTAHSKQGTEMNWHVFIQYTFTTPDKRQLTREESSLRHDLEGVAPRVGTPVKVLYLSDKWFKVV